MTQKLDWVPLYIQRIKGSKAWKKPIEGGLTDFQFGWYWKLLIEAADNGGYLPGSFSELWQIAGAKSESYFMQWGGPELVSRYFRRTDDETNRIYNHRMLEVFGEQSKKLRKSRTRFEKETESLSISDSDLEFGVGSKNKEKYVIPSWIPEKAWLAWEEMRAGIKPKLTDEGRKRLVMKLDRLRAKGYNLEVVIYESVMRGWRSFFAVEDDAKETPQAGRGDYSGRICANCSEMYKSDESHASDKENFCCEACESENAAVRARIANR